MAKSEANAEVVAPMFDEEGNLLAPEGERVQVVESDGFVAWDAPGAQIKGVYLNSLEVSGENGPGMQYVFQTGVDPDTGEVIEGRCNGTTKVNRLMANVAPGTYCDLTYVGDTKTNGGFTLKLFELEIIVPKGGLPAPEATTPANLPF